MSGFAEKLNVQICENSLGNYVHFLYGISGLPKKLNIPNSENSTENCVHYIRTKRLDLQKNWMSRTAEIQREIHYVIWTECLSLQKIEYPKLWKFNGNLCTLFMYGMSRFAKKFKVQNNENSIWNCVQYLYGMFGFAEKLHIQNCENSTENCVHYICKKCLDLQKIWLSRIA